MTDEIEDGFEIVACHMCACTDMFLTPVFIGKDKAKYLWCMRCSRLYTRSGERAGELRMEEKGDTP